MAIGWAKWGRCQLPRLDLYPRGNCNIIWMKLFVCVCVCVYTHAAIQENCEVRSGIPNLIGPQMEFYVSFPKLTSSLLFLNLFNRPPSPRSVKLKKPVLFSMFPFLQSTTISITKSRPFTLQNNSLDTLHFSCHYLKFTLITSSLNNDDSCLTGLLPTFLVPKMPPSIPLPEWLL